MYGAAVWDLPGVRYRYCAGKLDTAGVSGRKQGRGKYGASVSRSIGFVVLQTRAFRKANEIRWGMSKKVYSDK